MRARTLNLCTGAFCFLTVVPALAQMVKCRFLRSRSQSQRHAGFAVNPRKSLLHPQPVCPDPVRPNMQVPATPPIPRPCGRAPLPTYPPGFTMTREKPARRGEGWQGRVSPGVDNGPAQISDALLAGCPAYPPLAVRQEITVRLGFGETAGRLASRASPISRRGAGWCASRDLAKFAPEAAISDRTPLRFTLADARFGYCGAAFRDPIYRSPPAHKPSGKISIPRSLTCPIRQHPHPRDHQGPGRDQAAPRPRARPCCAHQEARQRRLL